MIWYLIGLFFCLIGDVFLFLPTDKWFVPGIVSFLFGHSFYILSFGVFEIDSSKLFPTLLLAFTIIIIGILIGLRLAEGIKKNGEDRLFGLIFVYSLAISYMLFSTWYKFLDTDWGLGEALLLAGGAMFFYISDSLIAWDRFVSKFNYAHLSIMITYHLGQLGIAAGVMIRLTSITG